MRRAAVALGRIRSLGARLVLTMTAVGIAGAIAITLMLAGVITPSFRQLERRAVNNQVERTQVALAHYSADLESTVRDFGDWNAGYDYLESRDRAFEEETASPRSLANFGIDGLAFIDNERRILIARWINEMHDRPATRAAFVAQLGQMDLSRMLGDRHSVSFYARFGETVAAVGLARVRRSDGTGTPRGFIVMARTMTAARLSELLGTDAVITPAVGQPPVDRVTASRMTITVPFPGAGGEAVASARFTVERDVVVLGRRMLLLAIAGSTLLLLMVLLVLRRIFTRMVLRPLSRVQAQMELVRTSGSIALLEEDGRRDEIGALGTSFNAMLSQLKDLREQVEAQSFALGRSESAVAVMHNVRNALNPISTILSVGTAQRPPVDRAMLDRTLTELAQDDVPADRREKLAAFAAACFRSLEDARVAQVRQLDIGREAMAHVLEVIGEQQAHAHERPVMAPCDITEIVAQHATIARYIGATSIVFRFPAHPMLAMANRVILSQVIGNLFSNAVEAIASTGRDSGSISVSMSKADGQVSVRIRDDGEGFAPETRATLFQRGFSTRAHKSGGLGLHWCANSMTAMDGSLRLESEGKGTGAVAILTLKAPAAGRLASAA